MTEFTLEQLVQLVAKALTEDKPRTTRRSECPLPRKFDGTGEAWVVENWITEMNQYLRMNPRPESEQLDFVLCFLTGNALRWWSQTCRIQGDNAPSSWDALQSNLKAQFIPAGTKHQIRGRLANLQQTGTVRQYVKEFNEARCAIDNITNDEALDRFLRGLQIPVYEQVLAKDPQTVERAMELAQYQETDMFTLKRTLGYPSNENCIVDPTIDFFAIGPRNFNNP